MKTSLYIASKIRHTSNGAVCDLNHVNRDLLSDKLYKDTEEEVKTYEKTNT